MEEKEFNSRKGSVDALLAQAQPLRQEINTTMASVSNDISNLVKTLETRDGSFSKYLDYLKDFNYSDAVTTPTDLFPGIRTISDTIDPEELNQKTQNMKELATTIEENHKRVEALGSHALQSLKKVFGILTELMIEENQIYDLDIDILQDLDSIYDIGQIARATK